MDIKDIMNIVDMDDAKFDDKQLNRRQFLIGSAAVAGSIFLASCGGQSTTTGSGTSTTTKKYTIALVQGVKGDPFYVTMQKGAQAEADKLGATLIVDGPVIEAVASAIPSMNPTDRAVAPSTATKNTG